jgi:polysaccharide export outer membrane protein
MMTTSPFTKHLHVVFIALLLHAGLAAAQPAGQPKAPGAAAASDAALTAEVQKSIADYQLGPDDKVRVTVFDEGELSGEFSVSATGKIAMPLIGDIRAGGLTVDQLKDEVERALREGYLKDPKVNVEVTTFRPFYILGEVNKPALYPYTNGLSVLGAVATAGGFTYRANTHKVFIRRANEEKEREYPLTSITPVAPGDTIRIAERFF